MSEADFESPKRDAGETLAAAAVCCRDDLAPKIRGALALLRLSPLTDTDADLAAAAELLAASIDDVAGVTLTINAAATLYADERSAVVRKLIGDEDRPGG
jgi:hypothetical protein